MRTNAEYPYPYKIRHADNAPNFCFTITVTEAGAADGYGEPGEEMFVQSEQQQVDTARAMGWTGWRWLDEDGFPEDNAASFDGETALDYLNRMCYSS